MILNDSISNLETFYREQYPELDSVLERVRSRVPAIKREIATYQAMALYALYRPYNRPGVTALELGTAEGYSAAIAAEALTEGKIITLNPDADEVKRATDHLKDYPNVRVVAQKSWDYLKTLAADRRFDIIFVDSDHKRVRHDFPFWNHVAPGGLLLFHDYSPLGATQGKGGINRECPPVYEGVRQLAYALTGNPEPEVRIVDNGGVGMAGILKSPLHPRPRVLLDVYPHSILDETHLNALYDLAMSVRDLSGAVMDIGCGAGGSGMALWFGARRSPRPIKRDLWLFDSFTGVPEPDAIDGDKAHGRWADKQARGGWCPANAAQLDATLRSLKIPDSSTFIEEGPFEGTFQDAGYVSEIAILHIDATLYRSTALALTTFYDRVADGGLVIVEAAGYWQGVKQALDEFRAARKLDPLTLPIAGSSVWWRK